MMRIDVHTTAEDLAEAAADHLVDRLIVAVARNAGKAPLFDIDERMGMVRDEVAALNHERERVVVWPFGMLLMDFAAEVGARFVIRGLRAVSDFEYEFQMAGMNARLSPEIETVFLMASDRHQFIASRFVKEIGELGGDISHFVSPRVAKHLERRFQESGRGPGPHVRSVGEA